jgi:hypothetical protein
MRYSVLAIAIASISLGVGFLFGQSSAPYATELSASRTLAGYNVELIGFFCGDHAATVLAQYEDEFPETGCREIRRLDDERPFLHLPVD